jgi:acyl-CoA thioester hydrolase
VPLSASASRRSSDSPAPGVIYQIHHRVNYSEVDQMGVVYHARYLVWLDMARTEYLRQQGMSYREFEERGYRLAVGEVSIKYRHPARYDDLVRVRCWVQEAGSRRVTFGYAIEHDETDRLLATATTAMLSLDPEFSFTAMPEDVRHLLVPTAPPVRL